MLPHFKLDDASTANDEEEEIPLPSLTKLTCNQEQLIFPEAFTKRWSGHEKYGDSFTELVEKAEAVTAFLTSMIQGSPAKSNAGKRELESPSPAQVKRLKSETVHAEADVDVLPGGLLAKVPLKTTAVCRSSQGHVCFWCMMLLVMRLRRLRQGRRLLASMAPLEHGGRNAVPRRTSK